MLTKLRVKGFKSLADVAVGFPRLTVLFGPNAAGKSNLIEAVGALSLIGTSRTLSDVFIERPPGPIRGLPAEAFAFPPGGLVKLLGLDSARFELDAELSVPRGSGNGERAQDGRDRYRYRVAVEIEPRSGDLSVQDEYLTALNAQGESKGAPAIGPGDGHLSVRRAGRRGRPMKEPLGQNHSMLSDLRFSGQEYRAIERVRNELLGWSMYYLDPRVYMRLPRPPSEVTGIGEVGHLVAPFLYRLAEQKPKHFAAVRRTLRSLIPTVEDLGVELDKRRGTLDIHVKQGGIEFSSRVMSEGTLRVLALCCITVNPWSGSVIAFEEPENGVHPRRLELIAKLLTSLAMERESQVIVSTHSPLFCDAALKVLRSDEVEPSQFCFLNVRCGPEGTVIRPFGWDQLEPILKDHELARAMNAGAEDVLFENLILRGLLGE